MAAQLKNIGEEYQRFGKNGFDAMHSYGEASKGFQACAAEITDYSKRAFDDCLHTWEQLIGVTSIEQAVQIQSQYAKRAYENYVAEMTKLGEMFTQTARNACSPVG
jgi:hypothetical protein